jgi:uncharacterized membrane protein YhaH (DUF805 family)
MPGNRLIKTLLARYLSFHGRLARVPYFVRSVYLGIAASVIFVAGIALFSSGSDLLWWMGLLCVIACFALIIVGSLSLVARRLHDLGWSGYHAIWMGAADVILKVASYGSLKALLFGLPLTAIGLWLVFWPGNVQTNRFGGAHF